MIVRRGPAAPMWEGTKVFVFLSGGLVLAALFYPFDTHPLVSCPLRTYAHFPCPACGMTRAFVRLTHGHLAAAVQVNPLGAVLAALAVVTALYGLLRFTTLKRGIEIQFSRAESLGLRVGIVVAGVANWAYLIVSGAPL